MNPLTLNDRIVLAALKNNKFQKRKAASVAKQVELFTPEGVPLNADDTAEIVHQILNSPEHATYIKKYQGRGENYDEARATGQRELDAALAARELVVDEECDQWEIDDANQAITSAQNYLAGVPANVPGETLYELKWEMFLIFRCAH